MSTLDIEVALERALNSYLHEFEPEGYRAADFLAFAAQWLERQAGPVNSAQRAAMRAALGPVAIRIYDREPLYVDPSG